MNMLFAMIKAGISNGEESDEMMSGGLRSGESDIEE